MLPGTRPSLPPSSWCQDAVCLVTPVLSALPPVLFFLCSLVLLQILLWKRKTDGRAFMFIRLFLWSSTIGTLNILSHLLSRFYRQFPEVMELMNRRVGLQPTPASSRIYPSEGGVAREHVWDQMVEF